MATAEVSMFAGIKEAFLEPWRVPDSALGTLSVSRAADITVY